jgi:hypothetical protein
LVVTGIRSAFVLLAMISFSSRTYAVVGVVVPGSTAAVAPSPVSSSAAATTPAAAGPSINPAANTGQGSQSGASLANAIASAMLMAAAMAQKPPNPGLLAMSALAAMQAAADSGAADQSGSTATTTTALAPTPGTGTATPPTDAAVNENGTSATYSSGIPATLANALTAAGVTVTPSAVTMPDGTTVPSSAFSSPASMTAAGLDGASAAKVLPDIQKAIESSNAGHVVGMGTDSGGGGGGGGAASDGAGALPEFKIKPWKNPFETSNAAKAKFAAGKTLSLDGESVGVKMDDIFAMINRAYDRKKINQDFIDNPKGTIQEGAAVRLPASTREVVGK